jgi:hypothetical protein
MDNNIFKGESAKHVSVPQPQQDHPPRADTPFTRPLERGPAGNERTADDITDKVAIDGVGRATQKQEGVVSPSTTEFTRLASPRQRTHPAVTPGGPASVGKPAKAANSESGNRRR